MNRTIVEQIKARVPIEDLVGSYLKLDRAGKSFKAKCPFHNEKTASFFVSPERGGYYCFGCNAKGDIFSFVEQFEGLDFKGALKVLAERAGVPIVEDRKTDSERDRLFQVLKVATEFFQMQFEKSKIARDYVKNRGIVEATIKDFRIGWAPDGWKNLCSYLKGKGWSEAILEKAGLIKLSNVSGHDARSYYDRFRGRIIFPIADSSGRIIAFTGRILKDDGKSAKYLNSPDSPIFDKSMILFGLDKAKTEIRRKGYSILVEGQMDLIMSHQIGIKNVVASSGTALSDEPSNEVHAVSNLGLIRRLSPNLIIAMDSDNAGRKAAMRAVASTALSLGMSVKIADIEGGKDPADLIITNPESWKNVLRQAKHVVEYELGNIMKEVADNHKLARAIKDRLFPFLARIDSEMDKAYFVKIVAEKAGLNEQAVWEDLRKFEKEKAPDIASKQISAQAKPSDKKTKSSSSNHIDLVERRMFGLLHLMESVGFPLSVEYREQLKKIAGNSYEERVKAVEPLMSDIIFEAESFYGKDKEHWDFHMKELLINFEEDLINEELISSMTRLKIAEREGNQALVSEMAQKCQVLSIRKAETVKRRKN